ncbi:hypothetical protein [Actinoplanes sp. N902-109]|uniref:hypothetical protein n=1 Tax=Actinoplanes sp. (strain N902-109) TaxID=649831 RepID=UPI00039E14A5|nr:hypothetical protein [Actinoplanes sp. N902-109]
MDWQAWHHAYADPGSPLSRRLRLIQGHLGEWLDGRPDGQLDVVSVCAGQAHDLVGVLAGRADAGRVRATLIEDDAGNVAAARERIAAAGLGGVAVVQGDAGELATYAGVARADLLLLAGVFGNISDADVRNTIGVLPQLCASGATVIWTRVRAAPDLVPSIREWFAAEQFVERAFHAPDDVLFTVGVHEFQGEPRTRRSAGTIFRFSGRSVPDPSRS